MTSKQEDIFGPLVRRFVEGLEGRYQEHASDKMLESILMWRLSCRDDFYVTKSQAALILEGDPNAAYNAACPVFESILEHGARAGGNGHHVAQDFAAAMNQALVDDGAEAAAPEQA